MECFSTERHKNFINAILEEDHFVLPPAERTSEQEKNLREVDCKTPQNFWHHAIPDYHKRVVQG